MYFASMSEFKSSFPVGVLCNAKTLFLKSYLFKLNTKMEMK